ncbi:hypothetical protein ACQ5SO_20810 [Rhodovulum sp. DZ06]|uniref:hypothetical protein n=1 Tax=Rhodovulum sp. DZ06 TaxID=3425126 RepID=UPI003D33501F
MAVFHVDDAMTDFLSDSWFETLGAAMDGMRDRVGIARDDRQVPSPPQALHPGG